MISTHQGRSYTTRAEMIDGKRRVGFVLTCAGCGRQAMVHMDPNASPDFIIRKFVRQGWAANERNEKGCFCPNCLNAEKPRMPVQAEMPKGPTHDQLKRIAETLRGCFAPEDGHYLAGATDQRVADELGMPWGWVKQCRELLGFVIKVDPEIKAIRDEMDALADMILVLGKKLDALERRRAA
jgi:hypothetical protein